MTITAPPVALQSDARDVEVTQPLWEFVADSGLQSLVCATSKDPNAKVAVLLVSPQTGGPVFAVKAPTTATAERAVDAEARMLEDLGRRRLGAIAQTIPRLVQVVEFEGRRAPVMSALPGRPMSTNYALRGHTRDAATVAADFEAGGSWLAGLQQATAGERAPLELDAGVAARLGERFAADPALESDLVCLEAIHARLRRSRVPQTVVHGDFWVGNILTSNGHVSGVVDWEAAAMSGEPVRDLVRFANMYALYLDRGVRRGRAVPGHLGLRAGTWGAGIEYAMYGAGWFPSLYRRFLEDGLARLGADRERWHDAALAGIAEVAALTDHEEFGRLHLELFRRLSSPEAAE